MLPTLLAVAQARSTSTATQAMLQSRFIFGLLAKRIYLYVILVL